jgi:hypothetical protein
MSSPLERALLRLQTLSKGPSLGHFFKLYLTTQDILNLRLTSRSLCGLAELKEIALETVYIHTPVPAGRNQYTDTLDQVGRLCRHVVVKIAYPPKSRCPPRTSSLNTNVPAPRFRSGSDTISDILGSYCPYAEPPVAWKFVVQKKPGDVDQNLLREWCAMFELLPNLETVHIACNGDPAWPGCTDIESALIILRIALERVNPEHLHTVCLSPIHPMGIMHLRWAGAGAYGEACASKNPVWSRLKVLKLDILSPYTEGRLSTCQTQLFEKIFADYLQSFSRTLMRLDLSWLGAASPISFVAEHGHQAIKLTKSWTRLIELRINNVTSSCSISTIKKLAPNIQKLAVTVDVPNTDERTHRHWNGYGRQKLEQHENDNVGWKTVPDVRTSMIPEPLFSDRLV